MIEGGKFKIILLVLLGVGVVFIVFNWVKIIPLFGLKPNSSQIGPEMPEIIEFAITGRVIYIGEDALVRDNEGFVTFYDKDGNPDTYRKGVTITNAQWFAFDAGLTLTDENTGETYFGYARKKILLAGNAEVVRAGETGAEFDLNFEDINPESEIVVYTKDSPYENDILTAHRVELRNK